MKNEALGMLETNSFPAMVAAADAMCKAANVALVGYEKIGDAQCTAIIRGDVAAVQSAIVAGKTAAIRVGCTRINDHVIPRPHESLADVLPIGRAISAGKEKL
jgi:microcompartment protein CcmL/EutN